MEKSRFVRSMLSIVCVVVVFALALAVTACGQPKIESASTDKSEVNLAEITFIDDATCLSCHGESYEGLATVTADFGDWNPHDSIHGGYNSCVNCHDGAHTEIDNQCDNCHDYAPSGK
ncbi:MAG: cytochrome c3 family protein [Actinobacteria bacterium]|nr:cytochrome c3 family protein [Actinomycetota bacterium]